MPNLSLDDQIDILNKEIMAGTGRQLVNVIARPHLLEAILASLCEVKILRGRIIELQNQVAAGSSVRRGDTPLAGTRAEDRQLPPRAPAAPRDIQKGGVDRFENGGSE